MIQTEKRESPMAIYARSLPEQAVHIRLSGSLDAGCVTAVGGVVYDYISRKIVRLVLDLEDVDFFSSHHAGLLIGAAARARAKGGDLVLLNPSPAVAEVLDLLGMKQAICCATSMEEAQNLLSWACSPETAA